MIDVAHLPDLVPLVLGKPFTFRGRSPEVGFDCLGLVLWVYEQLGRPILGVEEPDNYPEEWWNLRPQLFIDGIRKHATYLPRVISVRPGDILCFSFGAPVVTHVGVVIQGDHFLHSFMGRGVMYSRMSQAYWRGQLCGLARLLKET